MSLANNILKLRKKQGLSQEQLGEIVDVTRQTISNWELGETSPNPEQLKMLSTALNVSIDELLDNEIKSVLEEKINNTEKLAGIIIKILKAVGIAILVFFIIDIVTLILFVINKKPTVETSIKEIEMECSINDNDYIINFGSDGYFNCSNCSKNIQNEIKNNYIDFSDLIKTENDIKNYFLNNNGYCY